MCKLERPEECPKGWAGTWLDDGMRLLIASGHLPPRSAAMWRAKAGSPQTDSLEARDPALSYLVRAGRTEWRADLRMRPSTHA